MSLKSKALLLASATGLAQASHFRYMSSEWIQDPDNPLRYGIKAQVGWRETSFYWTCYDPNNVNVAITCGNGPNMPAVGDLIRSITSFRVNGYSTNHVYGGWTYSEPLMRVTAVDYVKNYIAGSTVDAATLDEYFYYTFDQSLQGATIDIGMSSCCRIHQPLVNNNGGSMKIYTQCTSQFQLLICLQQLSRLFHVVPRLSIKTVRAAYFVSSHMFFSQ